MTKKQSRVLCVILLSVVLSPLFYWVKWARGYEVARSQHDYYTVIIHKTPHPVYRFNPVRYFFDQGEYNSTSLYEFTVYTSYHSVPLTSFSTPDEPMDPWGPASIKWLKSREGAGNFVISFDGRDTFACQFGHNASWRRL